MKKVVKIPIEKLPCFDKYNSCDECPRILNCTIEFDEYGVIAYVTPEELESIKLLEDC